MLTFQLIMKSINIVIVTALAIVINLKVSQPSAAKENKPNGCFCVGLNIGFSYREPFLMPSVWSQDERFSKHLTQQLHGNRSVLAGRCGKLEKKMYRYKKYFVRDLGGGKRFSVFLSLTMLLISFKKEKMGHSSLTQLRWNQLDPAVWSIRNDCSWLISNYRISIIGNVSGWICGLTSMIPGFVKSWDF